MKAFPQSQFRGDEPVDTAEHGGMLLRDYFAAKAMQALVSKYGDSFKDRHGSNSIGDRSYKVADAMMEARNEQ